MANQKQLRKLKQSVEDWNSWRKSHPNVKINLRGANLKGLELSGADFSEADIRSTNFSGATLIGADFTGAKCGLGKLWLVLLSIISWLIAVVSGFLSLVASSVAPQILHKTASIFYVVNPLIYVLGWIGILLLATLFIVSIIKGAKTGAIVVFALIPVVIIAFILYCNMNQDSIQSFGTLLDSIQSLGQSVIVVSLAGVGGVTGVAAALVSAAAVAGISGALVAVTAAASASTVLILLTASDVTTLPSVLTVIVVTLGITVIAAEVAEIEGFETLLVAGTAGALVAVTAGALVAKGEALTDASVIHFIMILTISLTGIYVGWSALKGDNKDAWLLSFAFAFAALGGTSFRNANLTKTNFIRARLKSTDFRRANLTDVRWHKAKMLNRVRHGNTYLQYANVRDWLIGKGSDINFNNQHLVNVNLQGANLTNAGFIGTDLRGANLSKTFLTGVCIEDWKINSQTNLDNVICNYIYLKRDNQERRPSDPNRNFEPGEFAKLVEKSVETVDLIFNNGIDWKAFLSSYQDIQVEYGNENVSIQAIEKKSDGAFVIRLTVPPDANKAELESQIKQSYETKLQMLEAQYRLQLEAKDEQIAIYRHHNVSLENIVDTLASAMSGDRIINTGGGEYRETNLQGNNSRYVETRDSSTYYENYNSPQEKTLAEAADEIQKLLQQLEQANPTATEEEKIIYVNDETSPGLKRRTVSALKAGVETSIEEFLDNSYVNVGKAVVKGWLKPE